MDVPEAPPLETEDGLVAVGGGWFVLNARDSRWNSRPGRQSVSTAEEVARWHGASVKEVQDADIAYADVLDSEPSRYRDGWLPDS